MPPRVRNPAIPPALEAVTMRALRKDPDERYQDADQFIAALEQAERPAVIADDPVAELEAQDERSWRRIALDRARPCSRSPRSPLGAYLLLTPDQKQVPDVVGETAPRTRRRSCRTRASRSTSCRSSPTTSPRTASPRSARPPGEEADEGSTVTITVSSGPGEAPIPVVQGLPADEATDRLREAGFKTEQQRQYSDTVAKGRVIETSPPEGTSVRKGSTVTLVVSRGKREGRRAGRGRPGARRTPRRRSAGRPGARR